MFELSFGAASAATLSVPASGGVVVSEGVGAGAGSGAGSALGAASAAALADAEAGAEAAGFAPFFLGFGAVCARASGATPRRSSATVAKKERRCRVANLEEGAMA